MRRANLQFMTAVLALVFPVLALANSTGKFDVARPQTGQTRPEGCSCHAGVLSNITTRLLILWTVDGTPSPTPSTYVPGKEYGITAWVVGVPIPTPGGIPGAGFNLEPTAGDLIADDPNSTQILRKTECIAVGSAAARPCSPTSTAYQCKVEINAACPRYDPSDPDCDLCSSASATNCRACDGTNVYSIQAAHIGKSSDFNWSLKWIAPPAGTGPVTFYLAGNVVNGNGFGQGDTGDNWSALGFPSAVPGLEQALITIDEQ